MSFPTKGHRKRVRAFEEQYAMRKKKSQLYQSVILTFNDGTTGIFIGMAVVAPGDVNKSTVTAINFTPPKPLPPGLTWEQLP
jgi:hypothetical protein